MYAVAHTTHAQMSAAAPRVALRRNGSDSSGRGYVTRLPPSFTELLHVADAKLFAKPKGTARRLFSEGGDEILPEDFECVEHNDVLFVSCGEGWRAPLPQTGWQHQPGQVL